MSVGVPQLDGEHKEMIAEISGLYALRKTLSPDALQDYVSRMVDHAVSHFDHEETHLRTIRYDELAEHREVHGSFLEQLRALEARLQADAAAGISDAELNALARWLFNHILAEDKDYAVWAARRLVAAPAEC